MLQQERMILTKADIPRFGNGGKNRRKRNNCRLMVLEVKVSNKPSDKLKVERLIQIG
jgi:hypothetical protein